MDASGRSNPDVFSGVTSTGVTPLGINPNNSFVGVSQKKSTDFESGFGPFTDRILNKIFDVVTNKDFQEKISDKLVTPLTQIMNEKIKPYIYLSIILYGIIIVLLFIIIYMLKK